MSLRILTKLHKTPIIINKGSGGIQDGIKIRGG